MFSKVSRREKGFTLIELLIVMALLGVLVAVLLPKYQDLTPEAKIAATQQNLESLRSAVLLYAAKYPPPDGTGPPAYLDSLVTRGFIRKLPECKISGSSLVVTGPIPSQPADALGKWYYNPSTGEVRVGIMGVGGAAVPITGFTGFTNYTGPQNPWEW